MTAQPAPSAGPVMGFPNFDRQLAANYTIEDLLQLPPDAPRVELRDGVMIVVPSPTIGHQNIGNLLWAWLRQYAPTEFAPVTAIGILMDVDATLEPDVLLLRQPVSTEHHYVYPSQVAIAVEIVSPGTKRRDRMEKPGLYADARIPHFWRIEQDPLQVFAYDLAGNHYELVADSDDLLILSKPFVIELRIRDITP
jgi:Uma2 family endonuclease